MAKSHDEGMSYGEMLMRVRAKSFVAFNWPDRRFAETEPPTQLRAEATAVQSHWLRFQDEHEPQIVGLLLSDVSIEDPVFVAVHVCSDGRVRRALWYYQSKGSWRWLGGDGGSIL